MKIIKVYEIGDVFDDMGYKNILVHIDGDNYTIRACYPDGIEHFEVEKTWFDNKKYIETIKLK